MRPTKLQPDRTSFPILIPDLSESRDGLDADGKPALDASFS
jgi:hypothetical protein